MKINCRRDVELTNMEVLPRDAMLALYVPYSPVSVNQSVRLSISRRCSTKMTKRGITKITPHDWPRALLANVNSRSRSLYAIARPSVCRLSVCLSVCRLSVVCLSVTFVRPTQAAQIFGNISTALGTLAIH